MFCFITDICLFKKTEPELIHFIIIKQLLTLVEHRNIKFKSWYCTAFRSSG